MNYRGEVIAPFGDGEYTFRLTVAGVLELEEKTKGPFATVFMRVAGGAFGLSDVYETLRLGLIGGGMAAIQAKKLTDTYVMPLADTAPLARLVLSGVMFGFEEAPPKGKEEAAPEIPTPGSMPPIFTEPPASSASVPTNSTASPSGSWWQ